MPDRSGSTLTTRNQPIISLDDDDSAFDCDIIKPEINRAGKLRVYFIIRIVATSGINCYGEVFAESNSIVLTLHD